ncbi:SDR family NAD(P)-dependent oxidoreductase [Falsiroseomonas tokyonensis]|uniref:SDR family NAD(P)-dependent oxidoreductase n=1 Tax=Falsiroseomonas tokyonensis TaxID=430521 RepID=A0ABV7BS94_9PROT|nr:SDR family NAD(P)-dependent oxidoreductase [Falsiroseomonas tokyonensis]MBU8537504.1 SDR family oxidoreductase [Falsiroseomonas tokyonensis]
MNKLDLQGRVAVVTGGARGIGLAVARRMIQSGASVSIWDADPAKTEESRAALAADGSVSAQVLDLADELAVAEATAKTLATHGKVDILVNNAGITGGNMPVAEIPPAQWRRVVEVNLTAPFLVSQALVPHLVANGWGRVVNVASVAGKEGNPNAAHYSASKAGLIGLTKSLAKELATKNVLVNCVTPAAAKTDIFNQMTEAHIAFMLSKIPMGRFVEVEEIAGMICWLASPDCSFSTGAVFDISGGRATY